MRYLIAYDICDPKRLQRVARRLEKDAVRCQKSVFLFEGTRWAAMQLLDALSPMLDHRCGCVQLWRLADRQPHTGYVRGQAAVLAATAVIAGSTGCRFIKD
jgi:CRISPR-associated protein Cas2